MAIRMLFCRRLLQRYRAICHFIDPFISAGIKLSIAVHHDHSKVPVSYKRPWNTGNSSPETIKFIADNFGIETNQFSKVGFTTNKHQKRDFFITLDGVKPGSPFISIPYVDVYFYINKRKVLVGNPMCQALREAKGQEKPGTVLIIHPGGGRGFISPAKKGYDSNKVNENNVALLSDVCKLLPSSVRHITLKTHPVPYKHCDQASIEALLPRIQSVTGIPLSVQSNNLIELLREHEFIINFGSSTVLWLLGSNKKWLNIIDQARFPGYKYHRQQRERASSWFEWAQNISLAQLTKAIDQYDKYIVQPVSVQKIQDEYAELYNMNAVDNIMKEIHTLQ